MTENSYKIYEYIYKDNKDIHITQTGIKLANIGQLIIKADGTIFSENIPEVRETTDKKEAMEVFRSKTTRFVDIEINDFIL